MDNINDWQGERMHNLCTKPVLFSAPDVSADVSASPNMFLSRAADVSPNMRVWG